MESTYLAVSEILRERMSQENLEIVRQTMDAANRRDLQTMDETRLRGSGVPFDFCSEGRVFRGHQGIREYFVTLEESFDDLRLEAEEVIDADGDRVVLLVWVSGRGEGSVIPVRHRYGRCGPCPLERSDSYLDPAEAIEAAGLSE